MSKKAALFLNGSPPEKVPDLTKYDLKICADGAYTYAEKLGIPVDYIVGDMDSLKTLPPHIPVIKISEQNSTDMEKCVRFLVEKNIKKIDVYGSSGRGGDHFLGNLYVALKFHPQIQIIFFDDESRYFFLSPIFRATGLRHRIISLFPFPLAKGITTEGLRYPLQGEDLSITERIGTRNYAEKDEISIRFTAGDLLLFIANAPNP